MLRDARLELLPASPRAFPVLHLPLAAPPGTSRGLRWPFPHRGGPGSSKGGHTEDAPLLKLHPPVDAPGGSHLQTHLQTRLQISVPLATVLSDLPVLCPVLHCLQGVVFLVAQLLLAVCVGQANWQVKGKEAGTAAKVCQMGKRKGIKYNLILLPRGRLLPNHLQPLCCPTSPRNQTLWQ